MKDIFATNRPEYHSQEIANPLPIARALAGIKWNLEQAATFDGLVEIDTETTGLDSHVNKIHLVLVALNGWRFALDFYSMSLEEVRTLESLLSDNRVKTILAHNMKYDYKMLLGAGVVLDKYRLWDTMVAERLILNGFQGGNSLSDLVRRYFGEIMYKETRVDFPKYSFGKMSFQQIHIDYALADVSKLSEIYRRQLVRLDKISPNLTQWAYNVEMPLIGIVGEMEHAGLSLDQEAWKANIAASHEAVQKALEDMDGFLRKQAEVKGVRDARFFFPRPKPKVLTQMNIDGTKSVYKITNMNSPKNWNYGSATQLQTIFRLLDWQIPTDRDGKETFGKDDVGQYVVNNLENFPEAVEFLGLLANYKTESKALSSFGENFLSMLNPITGKIHTQYRTVGAETLRFTCGDSKAGYPNMSQIPRSKRFRTPFVVGEGYKALTIDLSGAELRILASLSGDRTLLRLFAEGDPHSYLAQTSYRRLLGSPDFVVSKHVNSEIRQKFKNVNFGLAYGAGAGRVAELLGITKDEANIVLDVLRETIPDVFRYLEDVGLEALSSGKVVFNKRAHCIRYFPDAFKINKGEIIGENAVKTITGEISRSAKNAPIQGTNANMIKECMVELYKQWNGEAEMLLQVYDELFIKFKDRGQEQNEAFARSVEHTINEVCSRYLTGIKMESEWQIADSWVK